VMTTATIRWATAMNRDNNMSLFPYPFSLV
jgi:hypothetical protein